MIDDTRLSMDENHIYRLKTKYGEITLPSVTQMLSEFGFCGNGDIDAMLRGTIVHQATAFLDRGEELDMSIVPEALHGYIASYKKFLNETGFKSKLIEQGVFSEDFLHAGTLDNWGQFRNGEDALIDKKSGNGTMADWMKLQLSGYFRSLQEVYEYIKLKDCYILRLFDNEKYVLHPCKLTEKDVKDFIAVATVYHRKMRMR